MPKKRRHKGGGGGGGHSSSTLEGAYEGDEEEGLRCGEGTLRWPNGDEYAGEFRDGMREGTGTFVFAGGTRRYEGGWSHYLSEDLVPLVADEREPAAAALPLSHPVLGRAGPCLFTVSLSLPTTSPSPSPSPSPRVSALSLGLG